MNPIILNKKFANPDLNGLQRYKSLAWDDFLLITFEKHNRPTTNDREYILFKFDEYYYHQVWKGFIPEFTYINSISIRGVIQSPDGKSYTIIGTDNCVFVLKGNKCSPLLEGARFAGLGYIHYSPSTCKYYGVLSKRVEATHDYPRMLTFAEISLNFTKSGGLPDNATDIRQVIKRIVSFNQLSGRINAKEFVNMISPDMLIAQFYRTQSVVVSYINPDIGWKHTLKPGDEITRPLHFNLQHCAIRRLPSLDSSKLLSINPSNPCEMLYLHSNAGDPEIALLVASPNGIELEKTIKVPLNKNTISQSYCIFTDKSTGTVYHWSYETREIRQLSIHANSIDTYPSHISNVVYNTGNRFVALRPTDILDRLASSGDTLPLPVSGLISKFLRAKYNMIS
jgi:hypothetical protein